MNLALNQVRIALAILGAVALAMLLNRFIVTDKRRIERTVQGMADAASKGDIDLLFSFVSADYGDETMSRTHLKSLAARFLGGDDHANPKIQWMSVKVVGPVFVMTHVPLTPEAPATPEIATCCPIARLWAAEVVMETG